MTASGFRYVTFKPLDQEHLSLISSWFDDESNKSRQNSHVCFNSFFHQKEDFVTGQIDIEDQKKPIKSFVIFDNQTPCGYTHFYQTTQEEKKGCALAIYFHETFSENLDKEAVFIELFLDNYVFENYEFCIIDIDSTNHTFLELFKKLGFSTHTDFQDFVILIKQNPSNVDVMGGQKEL